MMRLLLLPTLLFFCACTPTAPSENENTDHVPATEEMVESQVAVLAQADSIEVTAVDTGAAIAESYDSDEYEDIDWTEYESSMTKDYSFVIVMSSKSYDAALERAKDASEKLGYKLDLRGLTQNDEMGLSLPEEVCEAICGGDVADFPQYLPRNDWGASKYVSVEYSNGFAGFSEGYYIVVVASDEKGAPIIEEALTEAREFYDDAYAKTCGVWMGCGC
jgi:hypothetical protein